MNTLLKNLCNSYGPSGFEHIGVHNIIKSELHKLKIDYSTDKFNNIFAHINGQKKSSILLDAHIDQVYMVVKKIEKKGFLSFYSNGIDSDILPGNEVEIFGKKKLPGIISSIPPHLQKSQENELPYPEKELFIDTGLEEKLAKRFISTGDLVGFKRNFMRLSNSRICANSLDNRISVFILLTLCRRLYKKRRLDLPGLTFMFSSQEEAGLRGAKVGIYNRTPDLAFVLDVSFGNQANVESRYCSKLGYGPIISVGPNYNRNYTEKIKSLAEKLKINCQIEIESRPGGTNANVITIASGGIPVVGLSIPIKNMHSPVEICDLKDIENLVKLLEQFLLKRI